MGSESAVGPRAPLRLLLSPDRGSPIRRILLSGFAVVFGLWLISAYVLGQRVTEAESRVSAITTKVDEGEEALFSIRERVLLSSVLVRDAAFANGTDPASRREELAMVRDDVERALQQYLPSVDSDVEREHWATLRAELDGYWTALSPLLAGQLTGDAAEAFVRTTVIPQRKVVLRLSEALRVLDQDAVREQQTTLAELHRTVRERLWWTSGVAVAAGLAVALFAATYIGRLESWIRRQHAQELQHKRELQRLSAELDDAREHERRMIARDLHDEIGQALMTIRLDLGVVDRSAQLSGSSAAALTEARSSTDHAIRTVRDLSQLLHPPMLDDFGLAATLQPYVRGFMERSGVRAELVLDRMDARLPPDVEVCAYRIVQEALTNVAKHAEASACRVYLNRLPYSLLVTVEDDGKGMAVRRPTGDEPAPGVGLVSVRERVSRAGGTVKLESAAGRGTRLTVELPVAVATAAGHPGSPHLESAPVSAAIKT